MQSAIVARATAAYRLLIAGANLLQSPLLLVLRLYWGWSFFLTGKGKLMNHAQTAEFFTSLNLPLPGLNAWMAGATECFGGLLLLVGLATRVTCIPLIVTMVVAYLTAESDALKAIFSEPDKFTASDPFLFLLTAVIVAFGPGAFSLDRWIGKKWSPTAATPTSAPSA